MLGRLTVAVALIVVSTMVLVDLSGWSHFRPVEYVGAAMAVIAAGLLVGAFIGRARWLILIGVLLVPALLAAALLPGTVEWSAGSPNYRPATVEQVQESYELGLGRVVLDLTRLSAQELAGVGTIEVSI